MADSDRTPSNPLSLFRRADRFALATLGLALAAMLALTLPFVSRQGGGYDEVLDLWIADQFHADWLVGASEDPSQMRLPMIATALVTEGWSRSDLIRSRLLTVAVASAAVVGLFLYCRREFGPPAAALAALALAVSPLLLAYARVALTESEMYLTCATVWFLWLAARFRERGTLGALAWAAGAAGIGVASKFTGIVMLAALLATIWQTRRAAKSAPGLSRRQSAAGLGLMMLFALCVTLPWAAYGGGLPRGAKAAHYAAVLAAGGLSAAWAWGQRNRRADFSTATALTATLAGFAFFAVAPAHVANPALLLSIVERFASASGMSYMDRVNNVTFYALALLLKPGIALGGLCVAAVLVRPFVRQDRRRLVLPYCVLAGYGLSLWAIDSSQAFYVLPLFSIAIALAADLTIRSIRRSPRLLAVLLLLCAFATALDIVRSFPDYHLNGYQYVGNRILAGRGSMGYACVATLPTDGLEQCVRWCDAHVPAGAKVFIYYAWSPWHVMNWAAPRRRFEATMGANEENREAVRQADYIVTGREMEAAVELYGPDLRPGWRMVDLDYLRSNYRKVFSVRRAFGLEVAAVWQRRAITARARR